MLVLLHRRPSRVSGTCPLSRKAMGRSGWCWIIDKSVGSSWTTAREPLPTGQRREATNSRHGGQVRNPLCQGMRSPERLRTQLLGPRLDADNTK
jgi:hypothetical protein